MLETWVELYQADVDERERKRAEREKLLEAERAGAFERRHTPMADRIRRVIAALPESERDKERHIHFFRDAMRSKYRARGAGRASVAEIGPALMSLGWRRERRWRGAERTYATVWTPPQSTSQHPG